MQLDLLEWRPAEPAPVREVVPFPMGKRVGEARTVAMRIAAKAADAQRQSSFRRALGSLGSRLSRSGLSPVQVDVELDAFTALVNYQLWCLAGRQQPGGAA